MEIIDKNMPIMPFKVSTDRQCKDCARFNGKNCAYRTHTIEGDAWCSQYIKYTNDDSCCAKFESKFPMSASSVIALVIALIGLVVALLGLTNVI